METRLNYRWRFFSLLLILEKWMIYRFRPSQKVWTKFRQNLHQSYFVCLFFFSSNQFKLRQKALKNYLYKRILKTAKLSQNKILRSSNLTGVETPKLRLFRSTSSAWLTIIDKSLRWKQYRMQIGGLKFSTHSDNAHAKFKIILSSFPNLLTCSFLIQHQQLQSADIN